MEKEVIDKEIIDIKLTEKDEEREKKSLDWEEFLSRNMLTVGISILGIILLGIGVLSFKIFNFTLNQPKVEILGDEDGKENKLKSENGGIEANRIIVEAAGEVQKPGVYELTVGSRVNDLLVLAGGLAAEADREWVEKNINMAAKLQDGMKIYVPSKTDVSRQDSEIALLVGDKAENARVVKININTASESELENLWGIGPVTAKKIIEGRPYLRSEELLEKKIVKSNVWNKIKDTISVY